MAYGDPPGYYSNHSGVINGTYSNTGTWTRVDSDPYTVGGITVTPNTIISGTASDISVYPDSKESIKEQIAWLQAQLSLFPADPPPPVEEDPIQCPKCQVHVVVADDYICGECRERM